MLDGRQFANNQIPSNRFSPIALNILSKIPVPNAPGLRENYLVKS